MAQQCGSCGLTGSHTMSCPAISITKTNKQAREEQRNKVDSRRVPDPGKKR